MAETAEESVMESVNFVKRIIGAFLFVGGSIMFLGFAAVMPDQFAEEETKGMVICTGIFLLGLSGGTAYLGWRWVKSSPAPPQAQAPHYYQPPTAPVPPGFQHSGQPVPDHQVAPNVTVVVQNAPSGEVQERQVVHIRCPHCGTTTPESERKCAQCGADLR